MRVLLGALAVTILALAPAARPRAHALAHVYPGGGYTADVFAHRGYAYLSSYHGGNCPAQGVRVYDLRDAAHPRRVATFGDGSDLDVRGTWTEKTIVKHVATPSFTGELAATSYQNCPGTNSFRGFGLFDVTDPRKPKRLALVRTDPGGAHELWLQPVGRRVYVYVAIPLAERGLPVSPGFRIFDVTDPRRPTEVGSWIAPATMRAGKKAVFVHSVRVNPAGTRAYVSYWDLGTVILDVSKPASPRFLGRTTDTQGAAHSTALTPDGKVMIETHETNGGRPSLWDVSHPRHPRLLGVFKAPKKLVDAARARTGAGGFALGVHDAKIIGHRAYFSWYALGVLVADISNPRRPRFVTQFLPPPSRDPERELCNGKRCTFTWGIFAERRFALASDMPGGLWVFRVR
jgi:LVIVD repeat